VEAVPAADEPAKDEATPAPEAAEPVKAEETPVEAVKETEPATETVAAEPSSTTEAPAAKEEKVDQPEKEEEKKETTPKAIKVGRRLSSRVGHFFKPKQKEDVATPAKVDENPPKIDEPAPVAPLENPVENKTEEAVAPTDESKSIEAAPAAPVVAAAA